MKNEVGSKYKETPLIDYKEGKNGKEISDIIIVSERVNALAESLDKIYKANGLDVPQSKSITGGYQISWRKRGTKMVVLHWFKDKMMVQLGAGSTFEG